MSIPTQSEVQNLAVRAYNWVASRVHSGFSTTEYCVSMYPAIPLTAKVPTGYTVPGVTHPQCDYVYQNGNLRNNQDMMKLTNVHRTATTCKTKVEIGPWADNQPKLVLYVEYTVFFMDPSQANIIVTYDGKPAGDTRGYPIKVFWRDIEIIADHRTKPAGQVYTIWTDGQSEQGSNLNGNKYFVRTEDMPAAKLLEGVYKTKLTAFCNLNWTNTNYDIHGPLFDASQSLADDFMFAYNSNTYKDCTTAHNGCDNNWPKDGRGTAPKVPGFWGSWGFSHRSKVCTWPQLYTTILRQDPLGLLAQAIHVLNKTNNPWQSYTNPWPSGVPGGPSGSTVTPESIANFCMNKWWRADQGMSMYQVPIIGNDERASSLRTNQMLILATLLGYRYLVSGWQNIADGVAAVLRETSVGGPGQPYMGAWTQELNGITRPQYAGSQLFVWERLVVGAGGGSSPKMTVTGFSWLRDFINNWLGLPLDDSDFILSTVETTATFAQAWRVYGYHKYGWLLGSSSTIPGY